MIEKVPGFFGLAVAVWCCIDAMRRRNDMVTFIVAILLIAFLLLAGITLMGR